MRTAPNIAVIGLGLGGTKIFAGLFFPEGINLHRTVAKLGARRGAQVGALVVQRVKKLLRTTSHQALQVRGIGICVPGVTHAKTGGVWAPNISG